MAGEWLTATVAELQRDGILLVEDGNHGEYRPRPDEFVDAGVAFIRAADMNDGCVLFESASKINERARKRITKGIGAPGDVLLSHKGTVGKVALVPSDAPAFVCSPQTTFWRTLDPGRLDRTYLYAFLRSPGFRAQLATRSGETDMAPYVSLTSQRGLTVALPPIQVQREIARIIGALDSRIELNQRVSDALDMTASSLFKSWFLDFDPVRAKVDGRDPALRGPIVALFPDSFVDSPLGAIPRGWLLSRLGDVLELKRGYDLPAAARHHGGIPVYSSSGLTGFHSEARAQAPGVVTGRYGTIGKVYFVTEDFWPLNTTLYVSDFKNTEPLFAFQLLMLTDFNKFSDKAAVPGVNRNHLHEELFVIPPLALQRHFGRIAGPCVERSAKGAQMNETLIQIRDALLSKLVSGEMRVTSAHASLHAA